MRLDIPRTGSAEVEVAGRRLTLRRLEQPMWPVAGLTRADVVDYYAAVAPALLAHAARRPLTVARFPDGVAHRGTVETDLAPRPDWLGTTGVPQPTGETRRHCVIEDLAGLLWLVAQGTVEFMIPAGGDPGAPRAVVWELEPGLGAGLFETCLAALRLKDLVASDGLHAWPASTGAYALRVVAGIGAGHTHEQVTTYAASVAGRLVESGPHAVTAERSTAERAGRVAVEIGANAAGGTIVAPYSLRAMLPSPGTCAPLLWDELKAVASGGRADALRHSPAELMARIRDLGDPAANTLGSSQSLPRSASA